jgi:hypothetical protein
MLDEQVIPIDFGQGLDTKSDPKKVVAGKFLRVENGVFTRPGQLAKRNGYTAIGTSIANVGTISSPKMVHGYENELLAVDQNKLLSYSSSQDAWISKGNYTSIGLSRSQISEDTAVTGIADLAVLGNYALYGWSDFNGNVLASVVDLVTGDILVKSKIASGLATGGQIKCVCLGGTTLCIAYLNTNVTNQIMASVVTFSGGGVVGISVPTAIASNVVVFANHVVAFDMIATATGGAFVYNQTSGPGITLSTLSTALAVSSVPIPTAVGESAVAAISSTSNGNLWIYWTVSTNSGSDLTALAIYYAVYSSVLVSVLSIKKVLDAASPYYVSSMIAKPDSTTQQTLYYGQFITNNHGSKHELEYTNFVTVTSAGSIGSPTLFANGVIPFSHSFTIGSRIYAVFAYRMSDITVTIYGTLTDPVQPTFFILELTNLTSPPQCVARFASGVANSYSGFYQQPRGMGNVDFFSSTNPLFACGVETQNTTGGAVVGSYITGTTGIFSYSFDFASNDANAAVNNSNVVILNGALTQLYDGAVVSEFGFHLFPEITDLTQGTGGSVADGTYQYLVITKWVDSQGNLHQSTPSNAITIVVSGGTGSASVAVSITTSFLTQKPNSYYDVYSTKDSQSIFFLIGSFFPPNSASPNVNALITITDIDLHSGLSANLQAYTYPSSSVLENSAPPPSMAMVSHNNRLFFVDAENPSTDIWYTKSNQPLTGVSPSALLIEQIDPKYGNIISLAEMDEKLCIFKSNGVFVLSGDGAGDTGQGISFSFPQMVPSDVGCSTLKSAILTPGGILFKSINGIYMLARSLQVSYIGSEVEQYNSQNITGADLVPGKSQIRFLTSSGLTIVYDYIFNNWSTFTNHTGASSAIWNGLYVYANNSENKIFKESPGSYLDDATAYSLLAQTSWLHIGSVQGFQRVRRFIMLGDYANGNSTAHLLSVSAAYDFSTTFQTAISSPSFGAASSSGVFQYRERLPQQKCDTVSLLIQETTTGSALEYIDITNMSFEAGIKKGVNKLGASQSVG